MVAVIALVVVVLAAAAAFGVVRSRRRSGTDARDGVGANEFLQAPPTSFPSDTTAWRAVPTATGLPDPVGRRAGSGGPTIEPAEPPTEVGPPVAGPTGEVADGTDTEHVAETQHDAEDDAEDEAVASRFRAPGSRSRGAVDLVTPMAAGGNGHHLEAALEPVVAPEPEPASVSASVSDDATVIDLVAAEAAAGEATPWHDVVLVPEPDAVDHVLQALINRARFKQVGVEEVATELVERSDLDGDDVSDVLASLVGRAEVDQARPASELTLFNDDVPSRPGQLTDFAKLAPADKKRIIVRVLCLLVARSEDQQLPPREDGSAPVRSWPLARAVWPAAGTGGDQALAPLPNRRLAKSG